MSATKKLAKRLAARLDTILACRRVRGGHPMELATWCRNAEALIRDAKKLT